MHGASDQASVREPKKHPFVRALPWLIALSAILIRTWIAIHSHRTAEDALITLRYAENLAAGRGFAYNPREHVLGTTTPLYTLLLAVGAWLFGAGEPAILFGKSLNILADGATCLLLCVWLRRCDYAGAGLLAAALFAVDVRAINWDSSLMETGLVTLACIAAITAFTYRRDRHCIVAVALLCLLRFDGLLLAIILGVCITVRRTSRKWEPAALFLAITLPWTVFATAYFGSPLPTSVQAKFIIYPRFAPGLFPHFGEFVSQMAGGRAGMAVLVLFLIGLAFVIRSRLRILVPATIWLLAYMALFATSKLMLFGWYLVPPLPVYLAIASVGAMELGRKAAVFRVAMPLLLVLWTATAIPSTARRLTDIQDREDLMRKTVGEWIAVHTPAGETVMVESIGYIGYYSRRPILDAAGLVSPEVLPAYRQSIDCPLREIIDRFPPANVLIFEDEYEWIVNSYIAAGRRPFEEYEVVQRWKALAGDPPGKGFVLLHRRQTHK